MITRNSEPVTARTIWKLIISALKESCVRELRIKDGFCPNENETIMIRVNGNDVFWIHISQVDEESAQDEVANWDDSPDL